MLRRCWGMCCIALALAAGWPAGHARAAVADTVYTVILEGGSVYDGLGGAPRVADVALLGDRIAAVGDLSGARAEKRYDVRGLAVAPGFIDIHSHADGSILKRPLAENYLRQGVTTAMGGQDGGSPYPVGAFLSRLDAEPAAINLGLFVGHGTVRARAVGNVDRAPTAEEMTMMEDLVRAAMEEGAFGLSSGLEYTPGLFARVDELAALARVTAPYGGLYISHIRDEGGRLLESVGEVIQVGEEGGVAAQVTHHKVIGPDRWGQTEASLRLIDEARARGVDVASDQYPYTASSTGLTILFPAWSKEGGQAALQERLADAGTRARVRADIAAHLAAERGGDPSTVVLASCSFDPALSGKSLADLVRARGEAVTLEAAAEVAMDLQGRGGCQGVFHSMSEQDVRRVMRHPMTMVSSDGGIPALGDGMPHPRNYGAFARVLGHYVREEGTLSFAEAVRKMTSLPASRLGLAGRGVLREGAVADVVVLDPEAIIDRATFAEPHRYAAGVLHVFVAGQPVLLGGELTGARSGRALRRNP